MKRTSRTGRRKGQIDEARSRKACKNADIKKAAEQMPSEAEKTRLE